MLLDKFSHENEINAICLCSYVNALHCYMHVLKNKSLSLVNSTVFMKPEGVVLMMCKLKDFLLTRLRFLSLLVYGLDKLKCLCCIVKSCSLDAIRMEKLKSWKHRKSKIYNRKISTLLFDPFLSALTTSYRQGMIASFYEFI